MASQDCIAPGVNGVAALDPTMTIPCTISGVTLTQGSVSVPAIQASWQATANPYITGLDFQYTIATGSSGTTDSGVIDQTRLIYTATDGVLAGASMSVRYRATGVATVGPWANWVSVTVPSAFVSGSSSSVTWSNVSGMPTPISQVTNSTVINNATLQSSLTSGAVIPYQSGLIAGQGSGATTNFVYSNSQPSSANAGDYWINTSVNPTQWNRWTGTAYTLVATAVTGTAQLTDTGNLGKTATWGLTISGTPANLAALAGTEPVNNTLLQSSLTTGSVIPFQSQLITGQGALATLNQAGSAQIANGSVIASKDVVGDASNVIFDPSFADTSGWSLGAGASFDTSTNVTSTIGAAKGILFASNGTTHQAIVATSSIGGQQVTFVPEPNRPYRLSALGLATANFNGLMQLVVTWTHSDGTSSAAGVGGHDYRTTPASAATLDPISGILVSPPNAVLGQFYFSMVGSSSASAGSYYVAQPRLSRAITTGELLYSQSYGLLIDSVVYTPIGMAASIAGQSPFATSQTVGYGSPLLTGFGALAPLSQVSTGASGQLYSPTYGLLSDANIYTALGRASSITGQSPLATQTAYSYLTAVPGVGSNWCVNSDFKKGFYGWSLNGGVTGTVAQPAGTGYMPTAQLYYASNIAAGSYIDPMAIYQTWLGSFVPNQYAFPVPTGANGGVGTIVYAGCLMGQRNCTGQLYLLGFNAAGTLEEAAAFQGALDYGADSYVGNGDPAHYNFVGGTYTITSGQTRWLALMVRMYAVTASAGGCYVWVSRMQLGALAPGQTTVPTYSPGSSDPYGDQTSVNGSAYFAGQGPFATISSVGYGSTLLTGFGALAPLSQVTTGASGQVYSPTYGALTDAKIYTALGTSAGIAGQSNWATSVFPIGALMTPYANLIVNSTGQFGTNGWTGPLSYVLQLGQDYSAFFYSGSTTPSLSTKISMGANQPYCLQGEFVSNLTAGDFAVDVQFVDVNNATISYSSRISVNYNGNILNGTANPYGITTWTPLYTTFTSPSNAAGAYVRFYCENSPAGNAIVRKLKLQYGSNPSIWSDEATAGMAKVGGYNSVNLVDLFVKWLDTTGRIISYNGLPVNNNTATGYVFSNSAPMSATNTVITISAYTLNLPGGSIALPSGSVSGCSASTQYSVYYNPASSSYAAFSSGNASYLTNTSGYVFLGLITTSSSSAPVTGGGSNKGIQP